MMTKYDQKGTFYEVLLVLVALSVVVVPANAQDGGQEKPSADAIFLDSLEKPPAEPWVWIRENPTEHRSVGEGLEIKIQPGSLMGGGGGVRNILVRPLPDGAIFAVIHVSANHEAQYEQAGLILYRDDDTYIKLVLETVDGQHWFVFAVEVETAIKALHKVPAPEKAGWIALELSGDKVTAHTWDEKNKHREIGVGEFPMKPRPRIGVFTHGGQSDADRWAVFKDFGVYGK